MNIASSCIQQAAAIAERSGTVCLVTSRSGKRWVVPKGCLEPGKTAGEIALQEAWEEAGLVGSLDPEPLGSYSYEKCGNRYHVTVFRMHVTAAAEEWPEQECRVRRWLLPAEALACLQERGLRKLLGKAVAVEPMVVLA